MVMMHRRTCLSLILAIGLVLSAGCGVSRKLAGKVMPGGSELKKRVMVTTPLDLASLGPQRIAAVKQDFTVRLGKSNNVLVFSYENPLEAALANKPPFGPGAPREIIDAAERERMHAVVTWSLAPIDVDVRRKGIWPFRETRRFYATTVIVNVVDVSQGAIIATHTESREFSIPEEEAEPAGLDAPIASELVNEIWDANLPDLLEAQVDNTIESLKKAPWRATLVSTEGEGLVIPAGHDTGIKVGDRFDVFTKGESVTAAGGKSYDLVGRRIGKIEVTGVTERQATFRALSQMNLEAGMIVQYRS